MWTLFARIMARSRSRLKPAAARDFFRTIRIGAQRGHVFRLSWLVRWVAQTSFFRMAWMPKGIGLRSGEKVDCYPLSLKRAAWRLSAHASSLIGDKDCNLRKGLIRVARVPTDSEKCVAPRNIQNTQICHELNPFFREMHMVEQTPLETIQESE